MKFLIISVRYRNHSPCNQRFIRLIVTINTSAPYIKSGEGLDSPAAFICPSEWVLETRDIHSGGEILQWGQFFRWPVGGVFSGVCIKQVFIPIQVNGIAAQSKWSQSTPILAIQSQELNYAIWLYNLLPLDVELYNWISSVGHRLQNKCLYISSSLASGLNTLKIPNAFY